ncbi:MAG: hypothetical protein KGJ80_07400 [Chloroflexota bacterium]|nr:hypothetical protein [Chloroflexota bacterium]
MKRTIMLLTALACWLLTACAPAPTAVPSITSTPPSAASVPQPSATRLPTDTPLPPSPTATAVPLPTAMPIADLPAFADRVEKSPHDIVKSADGIAELLVPPGAMPAGKTVQDLKITPLDPSKTGATIEGKSPDIAYQLEPDGLVFNTPLLLHLTSKTANKTSTPALILVSGNNISALPVVMNIDSSNGALTAAAPIAHFSALLGEDSPFTVTIPNPGTQVVGTPFNVTASIEGGGDYTISGFWYAYGSLAALPNVVSPAKSTTAQCKTSGPAHIDFTVAFRLSVGMLLDGKIVNEELLFNNTADSGQFECQLSIYGDWQINIIGAFNPSTHPIFFSPSFIMSAIKGSIIFQAPEPWVTVRGELAPDGTFDATGTGDVAGHHVIGVEFKGKITPSELTGDYSMGVKVVTQEGGKQVIGGLLPTGQPLTLHLEGHRKGAPSPSPAPTTASNVTCAGELPKAIEGFTLSQTLTDPAKTFGQDTAKVQAFGLMQVQVNSFTATDPNSPIDNASLSSTCFNTAAGATQFNGYLLAFHQALWQQVNPLLSGVFDSRVVGEQGVANGIQVGSYRTILNNVVRNLVVNARSGKTPSPSDLSKLVNLLLP